MFSALREKVTGFVDRIQGDVLLGEEKLEEALWDLRVILLESDVALEVVDKIVGDLKIGLHGKKVERNKVVDVIEEALRRSLSEVLLPSPDFLKLVGSKSPFVIVFVGVNGTGKTTAIAKIGRLLREYGYSCVLAASDTYRAAGIEQLEVHAQSIGVPMIKHRKGGDPAAVAYDAIEHAKAKGIDVVLIDTAGRAETNVNLLDEMKKIARVAKPDLILFVGDALAGNAAVEQARRFGAAVGIDGVILNKVDADAKGGSAVSIGYVLKKPIFFLGTGQKYEELVRFTPSMFIEQVLPQRPSKKTAKC